MTNAWKIFSQWAAVLACLLVMPTAAEGFGFIRDHFYTTDALSNTVDEMTATGIPVDSVTLPPPYNVLGLRGLCFGPDGLLYVVAVTDHGFDVLVLDSTGTIQATYSSAAHIDGNIALGKIAFATNGQFFVTAGFFLYAFTPGSPNPVPIYGNPGYQIFDVKELPSGHLLVLSDQRLDEITTTGSLVRTITSDDTVFIDGRAVEYDPPTDDIFVFMGGECCLAPQSPLMRLNGATGQVEELTSFLFNASDLLLSNERKLVVASRFLGAAVYDLNLKEIGVIGAQRMFITQMRVKQLPSSAAAAVPGLSASMTALLGVLVLLTSGLYLRRL